MKKKYEIQLDRIIKKGVQERVFQNDGTWTAEQKQLKNLYENKLYMPEVIKLFWTYEEAYDNVITQDAYVNAYKKISFRYLKNADWYDENTDKEFIEKCIEWRADRAYKSNLIELMTVKQLELLGYTVFRHKVIDIVMGVDLVAIKDGRSWYIHISKNTQYSKNKITKKGGYSNITLDKVRFNFRRDFKNHVKLLYDCEESYNSKIINGLPIFENYYVEEKLDDEHALDFNSEYEQLLRLCENARGKIKFTSTSGEVTVSA